MTTYVNTIIYCFGLSWINGNPRVDSPGGIDLDESDNCTSFRICRYVCK